VWLCDFSLRRITQNLVHQLVHRPYELRDSSIVNRWPQCNKNSSQWTVIRRRLVVSSSCYCRRKRKSIPGVGKLLLMKEFSPAHKGFFQILFVNRYFISIYCHMYVREGAVIARKIDMFRKYQFWGPCTRIYSWWLLAARKKNATHSETRKALWVQGITHVPVNGLLVM
jgi:hypothetical protein